MIALLKILDLPWNKAKNYLRLDLEHIEAAINQRFGSIFTNENKLTAETISGDSTQESRYVSNSGPGNTPNWDKVDLSNGVKSHLPLSFIENTDSAGILIGRQSGFPGPLSEISVGSGLNLSGTTLKAVFPYGMFDEGVEGPEGFPGQTGPRGPQGLQGPPGPQGDDPDISIDWPQGVTGTTPLSGLKIYFVSDTSGGAVTRKLTFQNGILISET